MSKLIFLLAFILLPTLSVAQEMSLDAAREEWRSFRSLPKQEQRRVHKVYSEFLKLSPVEQDHTREWAKKWLELSLEERAQVRHRLQKWERLKPEQQKELRDRWAAMSGASN